jgi:hypothetical protein
MFDDIFFPSLVGIVEDRYLSVESFDISKRISNDNAEGDIMFSTEIGLSIMKHVYERSQTSVLVICATVAGMAMFLFVLLDFMFNMCAMT